MQKNWILLFFLVFQLSLLKAQVAASPAKIQWMSIEQASAAYKTKAKPFFIDLYTDWCGWCKKMDNGTFQDPVVAEYINANFYAVKFNAESRDTVEVFGQKFWNSQDSYISKTIKSSDSIVKILSDSIVWITNKKKAKFEGRIPVLNQKIDELNQQKAQLQRQIGRTSHDLARDLMNNQMSYPTFVFLFDSLKQNFPIKGYQQPQPLLSFLSFIAEGVYRSTNNVQVYQNLFIQTQNASAIELKSSVKWKLPAEIFSPVAVKPASEKIATKNKKILILVTDDNNYSSITYEKGAFNDELVSKYVNDFYLPLKVNVRQKEPIAFKDHEFKNANGYHEFPFYLMQYVIHCPMLIIMDDKFNLISKIPGFYPPEELDSILAFFNEEAYLSKQYPDFKQEFDQRTK